MSKSRKRLLSDQVRQAIDDSGMSRYRIAQQTGIDESALAKFYNGHRGFSSDTLNVLCEFLGLELAPIKKRKK